MAGMPLLIPIRGSWIVVSFSIRNKIGNTYTIIENGATQAMTVTENGLGGGRGYVVRTHPELELTRI